MAKYATPDKLHPLDKFEQMFYYHDEPGWRSPSRLSVCIRKHAAIPCQRDSHMPPAPYDFPYTALITLVDRTNNRFLRFGKGWCSDDFSRQLWLSPMQEEGLFRIVWVTEEQSLNCPATLGKTGMRLVRSRAGIRIRRWISPASAYLSQICSSLNPLKPSLSWLLNM